MKLGHWGKLGHQRGLKFCFEVMDVKKKKNNNIDFRIEFLFMYKNKSSKFKNTCVTRLPKFDIKNEKPIPHIPEINADQICKKKEKTDVSSQK